MSSTFLCTLEKNFYFAFSKIAKMQPLKPALALRFRKKPFSFLFRQYANINCCRSTLEAQKRF